MDRGVAGVYRAALYDDTSLALLAITDELRYPVRGFAFHPSGTVIALATGRYDGGYFFEGDLVFWDPDRREVRNALTTSRQVVSCAFEDGGSALRVGFRPVTDDEDEEAHTVVFQGRVERCDWLSHDRWLDPDAISLTRRQEERPPPTPSELMEGLRGVAKERGAPWEFRSRIWGVTWLDHKLVATGGRIEFERWTKDGAREVRTESALDGVQLLKTPQRILIGQQGREWIQGKGHVDHGAVLTLDVDGDDTRALGGIDYPVAMASSMDGNVLLRDVAIDMREHPRRDRVMAPNGELSSAFTIGAYDCFNHYFPIFGNETLLALHGSGPHSHLEKSVCTVDPDTRQVRPLFPLESNRKRNAHLFSHGGCYAQTPSGDALITATSIHHPNALEPIEGLLTSRQLPGGALNWEQPIDAKTAWLGHMREVGLIVAALTDGRVLLLDELSGTIEHEEVIRERGTVQVVLSGESHADTLALGTLDGSILIYECRRDRATTPPMSR